MLMVVDVLKGITKQKKIKFAQFVYTKKANDVKVHYTCLVPMKKTDEI